MALYPMTLIFTSFAQDKISSYILVCAGNLGMQHGMSETDIMLLDIMVLLWCDFTRMYSNSGMYVFFTRSCDEM
jgi:hypothetical protein